jgi:hypothetical protein
MHYKRGLNLESNTKNCIITRKISLISSLKPTEHPINAPFYLPHMEYEESIGLVMGKMKFFMADFHVFSTFYS